MCGIMEMNDLRLSFKHKLVQTSYLSHSVFNNIKLTHISRKK